MQNAIRWVPTSPLVDRPQTKKLANSSQKIGRFIPRPSTAKALRNGLTAGRTCTSSSSEPRARRPTATGRSGTRKKITGRTSRLIPATYNEAFRQPTASIRTARTGRNTSWPVETLAAISPMAKPRWLLNQRDTMVAPSTLATVPVAMPFSTPQLRIICQGSRTCVVRVTDTAISARAARMVRRTPKLCMMAAANGPISP